MCERDPDDVQLVVVEGDALWWWRLSRDDVCAVVLAANRCLNVGSSLALTRSPSRLPQFCRPTFTKAVTQDDSRVQLQPDHNIGNERSRLLQNLRNLHFSSAFDINQVRTNLHLQPRGETSHKLGYLYILPETRRVLNMAMDEGLPNLAESISPTNKTIPSGNTSISPTQQEEQTTPSQSTQQESSGTPEETPTRSFETSSLYQNVFAFVKDYMSRYDCSHDFNHILRVLALSKHILSKELASSPTKKYHKQAVILAALLHDVGDKKYIIPGENPEQLVSDLLSRNGCPPRFVAKVALIVENVSYTNETKRPQLVKAIINAHPELAVVQDADRLDAIGAVGIGRVFAFGAVKDKGRGLQGSIEHFEEKLEKIEGMMKTDTGRQLAKERTKRLREFRSWWEEETGLAEMDV